MEGMRRWHAPLGNPSEKMPALPKNIVSLRPIKVAHFELLVMENTPTYTEAYNELQSIVKKMENADISVDELTKNIERALQLIRICKEKLGKTEEEVNKMMS